jgi:tRNA-specific 2-thiouridylase
LSNERLWSSELKLAKVHFINPFNNSKKLSIRTRYRAKLINCEYNINTQIVKLKDEVRAVTAGQSAVLYDGENCLGGGIII